MVSWVDRRSPAVESNCRVGHTVAMWPSQVFCDLSGLPSGLFLVWRSWVEGGGWRVRAGGWGGAWVVPAQRCFSFLCSGQPGPLPLGRGDPLVCQLC